MFENTYEKFIEDHTAFINKILNISLWCIVPSAPLVMLVKYIGVFDQMTYSSCLILFVLTVLLAFTHTLCIKFVPRSKISKYLVLLALELIIVYARYSDLGLVITLFLVPLISLLYGEERVYIYSCVVGYLGIAASLYLSADHWAEKLPTIGGPWGYIIAYGMSYLLEYLVMTGVGYVINKLIVWHMKLTYFDKQTIGEKDEEIYTDRMTGLRNKMFLRKAYFEYVIRQEKRFSIIIVDLDNFKTVNDKYGHSEGDRALKIFANVLEKTFEDQAEAVLARFGGDEFVVFLPDMCDEKVIESKLIKLKADLAETLGDDEHLRCVTMSNGAAIMTDAEENYKELFDRADNSVLYVKHQGKNNYHIWHEGDTKQEEIKGR